MRDFGRHGSQDRIFINNFFLEKLVDAYASSASACMAAPMTLFDAFARLVKEN